MIKQIALFYRIAISIEGLPMASVELGVPARRDWVLANPWLWLVVGEALCAWAWLWARAFGAAASDNRVILVALGLAAIGVAVTLRLQARRLGPLDLSPALQRFFTLAVAGAFALLALTVTGVLVADAFKLAPMPVYPGLAFVLFLVVAPISTVAAWHLLRASDAGRLCTSAETAGLLLLAALGAFVASCALDLSPTLPEDWDSLRFFLRSLTLGILVGAALVAASPRARRLELSLLVLFHFGGICTATLAQTPSPWLVTQIWTRIYRPYLEFMYLNNAYHFYAPDPGPSHYAWLRLIYEGPDGQEVGVWEKVPRVDGNGKAQHTVALEYQRYIALTEGTVPTETSATIVVIDKEGRADYAPFLKRRMTAVPNTNIVIGVEKPALAIPFDPLVPQARQYQPPNRMTKILLQSFARHGATLPHPEDAAHPDQPKYRLLRVKVYRVIHAIPGSAFLAAGVDPVRDPTYFQPFYMGEYNADGKLLDPDDPFLYWLLPIMRVPRVDGKEMIRSYAALHAGDPRWVRLDGEWIEPEQAP
jgi:hypothetical protein